MNRDPELAADDISLETFNPHRAVTGSHMAFGHGFHRCVGAELAKMELRMAYPMLAQRFPDLSMVEQDLQFRRNRSCTGSRACRCASASGCPADC